MKICPTCGRSIPDPHKPKRICSLCGMQIRTGHKWIFGDDGRARHRFCENPDSYHAAGEEAVEDRQGRLLGESE